MVSYHGAVYIVLQIMWFFALCVCAALAQPEDRIAEKKNPESLDAVPPTVVLKRAAPVNGNPGTSLPHVNEDALEKALGDRRFVQRQLKCATGEGPCDPIGRKIKGRWKINK